MPFVPIVAIALVVIVLIVVSSHFARKRRKQLEEWAQSKSLSFDPSKRRNVDKDYPNFNCFRQGSNRYAENVMQGSWSDRRVLCFDYHYETHSTNSKGQRQTHHHHFSAVIIRSELPLKPLFIRPEGFFDKLAEFVGINDIDFESAEFSRKFYVKADDRRWAYDVIHQRTMELLLERPQFTIQFYGESVLVYRSSRFSTEQFEQALEIGCGILERFPDYLIKQIQEGH